MKTYSANAVIPWSLSPSWSVIVAGSIVWTGGLARARREAVKRGGMLIPSASVVTL